MAHPSGNATFLPPAMMRERKPAKHVLEAALVLPERCKRIFDFSAERDFSIRFQRKLYEASRDRRRDRMAKVLGHHHEPLQADPGAVHRGSACSPARLTANSWMALVIIPDSRMWTMMVWSVPVAKPHHTHRSCTQAWWCAAIPTFLVFLFAAKADPARQHRRADGKMK